MHTQQFYSGLVQPYLHPLSSNFDHNESSINSRFSKLKLSNSLYLDYDSNEPFNKTFKIKHSKLLHLDYGFNGDT